MNPNLANALDDLKTEVDKLAHDNIAAEIKEAIRLVEDVITKYEASH